MDDSFFRHEARSFKAGRWDGPVLLAHPVPTRIAAVVAALLTLAIALFLSVGDYTRKVRVPGKITPAAGTIKVVANQFGRIVGRTVNEGDTVALGAPMFEVATARVSDGTDVDARIGNLFSIRREQLLKSADLERDELRLRELGLVGRQQTVEAELVSRQQELALQDIQIGSAQKKLKQHQALAAQGFVSDTQLALIFDEITAQQARRKALESGVFAVTRELLKLQEERKAIGSKIDRVKSQVEQGLAALAQEVAEHDSRRRMGIVAPVSGIVTLVALDAGQPVQTGTLLAAIIPAGSSLEAQLMVPSRAVGFIEPGQRVQLRLAAFSYQKFGSVAGTVSRVEQSPINDGDSSAGGSGEATYRVIITLAQQSVNAYGRQHFFKAGMAVEADILQDRRRLIEWIFDPIISAAKART